MAALASDWLRHLRLPLWNRWTKFHDTWQEARSQRSLPSLCFCADQKNMVATPTSNSLRHFRLLWNCWMEFNKTWWEARCPRPLPSLCFSDRSEKQMAARCLIGWYIFDFSSDNAERNSAKRDKKQDLQHPLPSPCFFLGPISKQKRPPWLIRQKGGALYSGARILVLI